MTLILYSEIQAGHVHVWGSCMGEGGGPYTEGDLGIPVW